MGRKCAVSECASDSNRPEDIGVTFHKIPVHSDIRPKWMSLCRIPEDKQTIKIVYICSRHFLRADFCNFKGKKYLLKQGVLPSVFPWNKSKLQTKKGFDDGSNLNPCSPKASHKNTSFIKSISSRSKSQELKNEDSKYQEEKNQDSKHQEQKQEFKKQDSNNQGSNNKSSKNQEPSYQNLKSQYSKSQGPNSKNSKLQNLKSQEIPFQDPNSSNLKSPCGISLNTDTQDINSAEANSTDANCPDPNSPDANSPSPNSLSLNSPDPNCLNINSLHSNLPQPVGTMEIKEEIPDYLLGYTLSSDLAVKTEALESIIKDEVLSPEASSTIEEQKVITVDTPTGLLTFTPDERIEALDFNQTWCPARIVEVDYQENEVLVHFEKYSSKYDEWICMNSNTLRAIQKQPLEEMTSPALSARKMPLGDMFAIGERCMASWSDSRKFPATISKVIDMDTYEVLFDDGFIKVLKGHRISKTQGKSMQSSPLFDPATCSKQERRDRKRKINIPALFGKRQRTASQEDKGLAHNRESIQSPAPVEEMEHWTPTWQNGYPIGEESAIETNDGLRKSVIVADPRLPPKWLKHLAQRTHGASIGKWDTIILNPEGRKFRTRNEIRNFIEENPQLKLHETIFDFSLYRRPKKAVDHSKKQTFEIPIAESSPVHEPEEEEPSSINTSLKIHMIDNSFKCPIEGCGKNFRRENLAQMHVKHYHPEYTKFLDSTPNVADLAYARTVGDSLDRSPGPERTPRVPSFRLKASNQRRSQSPSLEHSPYRVQSPSFQKSTGAQKSQSSSQKSQSALQKSQLPSQKSQSNSQKTQSVSQKSQSGPQKCQSGPQKSPFQSTPQKVQSPGPKKDQEIIKLLNSKPYDYQQDDALNRILPSGLPPNMYPDIKLKDLLNRSEGVPRREDLNLRPSSRPPGSGIKTLLPVIRNAEGKLEESESLGGGSPMTGGTKGSATKQNKRKRISSENISKSKEFKSKDFKSKDVKYKDLKYKDVNYIDGKYNDGKYRDGKYKDGKYKDVKYKDGKSKDAKSKGLNEEYIVKDEPPPLMTEPNDVIIEGGEVIKIVRMKQEEIINCTCGITEEDGLMIQCELCLCWQHAYCNNIQRENEVPEKYICYICQNPTRQRSSKKYFHDQDWLKHGTLPVGNYHCRYEEALQRKFDKLKKSHDLSGGLLELKDFLHTMKMKIKIAEANNHPKLYLWSKPWDKPSLPEKELEDTKPDLKQEEQNPDSMLYSLLAGKEDVLTKDGLKHKDVLKHKDELSEFPKLGIHSLMENNIEQLTSAPIIPQPEAAIESDQCKLNLLDHIAHCQSLIEQRLEDFEKQINALDISPIIDDGEDASPRMRQTAEMVMRDINTLNEFAHINTF